MKTTLDITATSKMRMTSNIKMTLKQFVKERVHSELKILLIKKGILVILLSRLLSVCFSFLDGEVTVKYCRSGSNNADPGSNNAGLGSDNARPGSEHAGLEAIMQVLEAKRQVLGSDNVGPWK